MITSHCGKTTITTPALDWNSDSFLEMIAPFVQRILSTIALAISQQVGNGNSSKCSINTNRYVPFKPFASISIDVCSSHAQRLFLLCGLGWFLDNMWLQCIVIILDRVQKDFNITSGLSSLAISVNFTGMLIGSSFWGIMSDMHGRKTTFFIPILFVSVMSLFVTKASTFAWFLVGLFFTGFFVSGSLTNDGVLFIESLNDEQHSANLLLSVFWSFGQLAIAAVGWIFQTPSFQQFIHRSLSGKKSEWSDHEYWTWTVSVFSISAFLVFIIRYICQNHVFESVVYLMEKNRVEEAREVAFKIDGVNEECVRENGVWKLVGDQDSDETLNEWMHQESASYSAIPDNGPTDQMNDDSSSGLKTQESVYNKIQNLLTTEHRPTTLSTWMAWGFISFGYTIFNGYLPRFLSMHDNGDDRTYFYFFFFSAATIPGPLIAAILLRNAGSRHYRTMTQWSVLFSALFIFMFLVVRRMTGINEMAVLLLSAMLSIVQSVMWGSLYTMTPMLMHADGRGALVGTSASLGRVFGICAPLVVGLLMQNGYGTDWLILLASFSLCMAFVSCKWIPSGV